MTLNQIHSINPNCPNIPITVQVDLDDKPLTMEVDTGAAVALISQETYTTQLEDKPIQTTSMQLQTYSGEGITVLGEIQVNVPTAGVTPCNCKRYRTEFIW